MRNQHLQTAVLAITIGIALTLGACTRSASTPPPATGEAAGTTPSGLNAQQSTMEAVRSSLLTQTAQAMTGSESTATSEPTEVVAQNTTASGDTTASAPEATAAVVATSTPGHPSTYTLHEGEHPYCIARRFDVNPAALLAVNGLTPSTFVPEGTVLTIPSDAESFPPPRSLKAHPTTYTVQPGDTIYAIACIFGDVDPNAIAQANGLSEPYTLSAGAVLNIP